MAEGSLPGASTEEQPGRGLDVVYYDGHCALCHGFVRFLLRRDEAGRRFLFAPLQGEWFARRRRELAEGGLPDSICVETTDGRLLVKSDAVAHLLGRLDGVWRRVGAVLGLLPRRVRDLGYDVVARIRHRLFGTREDVCPVVPARYRDRFRD